MTGTATATEAWYTCGGGVVADATISKSVHPGVTNVTEAARQGVTDVTDGVVLQPCKEFVHKSSIQRQCRWISVAGRVLRSWSSAAGHVLSGQAASTSGQAASTTSGAPAAATIPPDMHLREVQILAC